MPYKPFRDTAARTWRHVNFHLERDLKSDKLRPSLCWTHVWGLALSSRQTFDSVALLLADRNKPATLPLQASILTRSLLEALGNVLALTANPKAIRWFLADGYRRRFEQIRIQRELFGHIDKWKDWLAKMDSVLSMDADMAKLGKRRRRKPSLTIPEWPSPYWLTRRQRRKGRKRLLPALLSGNRARLFQEAYQLWYSVLSSYAHQRSAAAQMAIFASDPDAHWEPGMLESDVVSSAMLFFACIMSELEATVGMPPSADLRALWAMLWDVDDHAKTFVKIRYRRLLRLPAMATPTGK